MICFHANIEVREKLEEKGDIEIRDGEKTTRASKRVRRWIFGRPMEVAEGYKVARRRDDDIAIVTAGLRIRTEASPEVARASEWAREDGEVEIRNQRREGGGGRVWSGEGISKRQNRQARLCAKERRNCV
jgi:hypothetical protein